MKDGLLSKFLCHRTVHMTRGTKRDFKVIRTSKASVFACWLLKKANISPNKVKKNIKVKLTGNTIYTIRFFVSQTCLYLTPKFLPRLSRYSVNCPMSVGEALKWLLIPSRHLTSSKNECSDPMLIFKGATLLYSHPLRDHDAKSRPP